jgi:WhiB family redox-sensing transcriptional regulator
MAAVVDQLLMSLRKRSDWVVEASCRGLDPNLFFPRRGEDVKLPKTICTTCPVRQECLEYSMTFTTRELPGIWGGLTEHERKRGHLTAQFKKNLKEVYGKG